MDALEVLDRADRGRPEGPRGSDVQPKLKAGDFGAGVALAEDEDA